MVLVPASNFHSIDRCFRCQQRAFHSIDWWFWCQQGTFTSLTGGASKHLSFHWQVVLVQTSTFHSIDRCFFCASKHLSLHWQVVLIQVSTLHSIGRWFWYKPAPFTPLVGGSGTSQHLSLHWQVVFVPARNFHSIENKILYLTRNHNLALHISNLVVAVS